MAVVEERGSAMTGGRRTAVLGALLFAALSGLVGTALAAKTYPDSTGDVKQARGPDIVSVRVSSTTTKVTFAFRFAKAPPLRVSTRGRWVDMLLLGIDVPPLGPLPVSPGGEWRGAELALGTHGPSATGRLVRLAKTPGGRSRELTRFPIVSRDATLTFSIPRSVFGKASWFTFTAAAARESAEEGGGGGFDVVPARGTLRYAMSA
jgi:hypothetical protein